MSLFFFFFFFSSRRRHTSCGRDWSSDVCSSDLLFVAGIVPGILGGIGLMGMAYAFARRYNLPREERFSWRRVRTTARDALWAFLLPIIILGGIFGGIVTATEGAALAVVAALFVGVAIYHKLDLAQLRKAVLEG